MNVPEFPRPEMIAPPPAEFTDKKLDGRMVTNQSAVFCGRCKSVLLRWVKSISDWTGSGVVHTTVQFSSDVFQ